MTLALPVPAASQAKLGIIVKARPKLRGCKDERTEKERGEEEEKEGEEEEGGVGGGRRGGIREGKLERERKTMDMCVEGNTF